MSKFIYSNTNRNKFISIGRITVNDTGIKIAVWQSFLTKKGFTRMLVTIAILKN